ncbi:MAG: DUF3365 domain-containing protein [Nitrospirota bacterium]|nr:DUF3365 domain-containing protein [Nitrospirota bacterium]
MRLKNISAAFRIVGSAVGIVTWLTAGIAMADSNQQEQAAAQVTGSFLQELSAAMNREMSKGGPSEAIKLCGELAPEIANRLSRENGWRVTRVGTRVRNPLLGMPDAWEQNILREFTARAATGESLADMTYSEVVSEPEGQYFRFMKPIAVQPKCLLCHGPAEAIPEPIKKILAKHYPFDRATGYKAGDLRGAVSIKQPLTRQEH